MRSLKLFRSILYNSCFILGIGLKRYGLNQEFFGSFADEKGRIDGVFFGLIEVIDIRENSEVRGFVETRGFAVAKALIIP